MPLEITPAQAVVLGTIATILVYLIKRWGMMSGHPPSRAMVATILVAVSLLLALAWSKQLLPPVPSGGDATDWLRWLGDLFVALSPIIAFATLIYNWLFKRILDTISARMLANANSRPY